MSLAPQLAQVIESVTLAFLSLDAAWRKPEDKGY